MDLFLRNVPCVATPLLACRETLVLAPAQDEFIGTFVLACLAALGALAPRRNRMTAARGFAFAAAERMVDGVHRDAAVVRLPAHPALAAGLADRDVHVVAVRDRADRRHAVAVDDAKFARVQLD